MKPQFGWDYFLPQEFYTVLDDYQFPGKIAT
jgi:hypothetical protein